MAGTSYQAKHYKTTKVQYPRFAVIVKRRVKSTDHNLPDWGEDNVVLDRYGDPHDKDLSPATACAHYIALPGVVRVMVTDRDGNAAEVELPEER